MCVWGVSSRAPAGRGSPPSSSLLQPEKGVSVLTGCLPWGYILLMERWEKGPPSFVEAWGCGWGAEVELGRGIEGARLRLGVECGVRGGAGGRMWGAGQSPG